MERTPQILIVDFGSQTTHLIARKVRECGVYAEIVAWSALAPRGRLVAVEGPEAAPRPGAGPPQSPALWDPDQAPRGLVLSGGPRSVFAPGAPDSPPELLESGLPILGICYGMQLLAHRLGGRVEPGVYREYGPADLELEDQDGLLQGLPDRTKVWMSHGDEVVELPPGFHRLARTTTTRHAAMAHPQRRIYGVQFHPEVSHTDHGRRILENFLFGVCGCRRDWSTEGFLEEAIAGVREQVGRERVLCALSGGVDSGVAAALVARAVGDRLACVFIDTGLLRAGEREEVEQTFGRALAAELVTVDASRRFLDRLAGVAEPEEKRRRIGETFIRVFEEEARKVGRMRFLVQGTIYPDVIESRAPGLEAADKIKTHHNVGGLPADLDFELVEPLRLLFKDEVRQVGRRLGLPESLVARHPFPGPGLAVRILGPVTRERLDLLRAADAIVIEEVRRAGLYDRLWQAFAVLTGVRTTGVVGDGRTYGQTVAIRALESVDAMTADWARLPYDVLGTIARRITNEVPGVNRVVYDVTTKPPATMEWE